MKRIAIFASGSGSNAENIINHFSDNEQVSVELILTNNPTAGVIERGNRLNVPTLIFNKKLFTKSDKIVELLKKQEIDWVILAGFLWLVPENLIQAFPNRIINVHPALLPKYGGKGMWGHHVHEAVVANKEKESGITIHYVNEKYDEGKVIFQAKCEISDIDSPENVASKIHDLEFLYFPKVIENEVLKS
ncbi:phosphoribosylglycinamide formyltransferase [Lacihabitans sp. LS3-19]|uniref:phosphoribosylglycinamide formyltransferase n=1 Tax=Lacihabitans sp. LS3-19 TaxID=2487335 RepID=UPI0020CE03B5|nr:phosphoribosylglycinamide formyltransferase [Lacihabitans sp. LS3-19]MCP9768515.1 phosphoribosylglycinamide formyltransferase [Lacihabitans sp. LS3-19]